VWKYIFVTTLGAIVFVETWTGEVSGQSVWCPPGSTPVAIGYGNMCRCPDGSFASINGCGQHQNQTYTQPRRYVPPPPQNPPKDQQVASAAEAFGNFVDWIFTSPQFDATMNSMYNPRDILNDLQNSSENKSLKVPPGYADSIVGSPAPKPNITPTDSLKGIQDVKSIAPTSPTQTPTSSPQPPDTPLPPPGQLGINQGVTGFQQSTNVSTPSQTWVQRATNWIGCSLLSRC
jgi:hypothetical protein